jgi:predicted aspartyl protease
LSYALLKERKLQDAFDEAARAIAYDPSSARAHALVGTALLASGDFRLSVEEFRRALGLNEDEALAIAGLAMVDFYDNRLNESLNGLRRAVRLDASEPDYIFNLGQAAARTEHYKEAADAYEHFLRVAPRTDADRRARIRGLIDFLRYLGRQGSLYVPGGANRTVVSFEAPDGRPVIRVSVNGSKQPLRFVLDTGSGMSVISQETAQRLGLRPVARGGLARAIGGGGRFEIVYGYLSLVEIGEARVGNVPVYIRRFYDEKSPVDGYVGLSVLAKFIASVDYNAHTLTLVRERNPIARDDLGTIISRDPGNDKVPIQPQPGIELPMRTTSSGFLSGEVFIDGINKPLNFIIDTGATISVVSEKFAALQEAQSFALRGGMRVFGAAGVADNVKMVLLPRVKMGSYEQEKISAAVLNLEPVNETAGFDQSGILGGNFLRHFRIAFDFQRGVVRLERLDSAIAPPGSQTLLGREVRKP